jgi:hypothetical protein
MQEYTLAIADMNQKKDHHFKDFLPAQLDVGPIFALL